MFVYCLKILVLMLSSSFNHEVLIYILLRKMILNVVFVHVIIPLKFWLHSIINNIFQFAYVHIVCWFVYFSCYRFLKLQQLTYILWGRFLKLFFFYRKYCLYDLYLFKLQILCFISLKLQHGYRDTFKSRLHPSEL